MKIAEWIDTVTLTKPERISIEVIVKLKGHGVSIEDCLQTGSWWDRDRKCQKSFLREKESDRIFRLWRSTPKDNWMFGEEVLED